MTTAQAARELGLSARTIQSHTASGKLVPDEVTPGGHARWRVETLRRQMRALRDKGDGGPEPDRDVGDGSEG